MIAYCWCGEEIEEDGDTNWCHTSDGSRFCDRANLEDESPENLARPKAPQFQEGRHIYRPALGAEIERDGYHSAMALVAITDSAQRGYVVAYVPHTQVDSLLAHLNR